MRDGKSMTQRARIDARDGNVASVKSFRERHGSTYVYFYAARDMYISRARLDTFFKKCYSSINKSRFHTQDFLHFDAADSAAQTKKNGSLFQTRTINKF